MVESSSPVAIGSKLFVLDTNVILHDAGCLRNFEEHDIAVPITVLEELDRFKKGNEDINFQARAFLRRLDELTGDMLSPDGTSLGPGLGNIRVIIKASNQQRLKEAFLEDCPDHRILDVALTLQQDESPRPVVLVTKDTNLRMKAKSLGLIAQDYSTDKVESMDKLYTGKRLVQGLSSSVLEQFFTGSGHVPADQLDCVPEPIANENFVLRNGSKSVLATYNPTEKEFIRIDRISASWVNPRNSEQSFALRALLDDQIQAKLDPYMQPLYDNMAVMQQPSAGSAGTAVAPRVQDLLAANHLEVTPLAYIRGRSLQRVFFIVDEAQNLTPHEIKTIITRAGEGTKIVFTGDIQQIDHPYLDSLSNGLSYLIDRMVGQPLFAHVTLEKANGVNWRSWPVTFCRIL